MFGFELLLVGRVALFLNARAARTGNLDLFPRVLFWQSLARCLGRTESKLRYDVAYLVRMWSPLGFYFFKANVEAHRTNLAKQFLTFWLHLTEFADTHGNELQAQVFAVSFFSWPQHQH